ncbi:MAG: PH domain-containing protein [Minisyncoccota bacterium]
MPNDQLVAYIRSEFARGVDRATVIHSLVTASWKVEDINAAIASIDGVSNQHIPSAPQAPMASAMTLKDQYPLSPRKYWKKMIEKTFLWIIILVLASPIVIIAIMGGGSTTSVIVSFSIVLLILAFIMGGYSIYVRAYIHRYYYDATGSYITIKKGVFAPAEIHVQYTKIQDVYVDQDIIDRIMGLYDVHLASATAASGIEAHIDGVEKTAADCLKNFLLQKLQNGGSGMGMPVSPNSVPNASQNQPNRPVTFASEISSRTYPITGAWYVQQMFTWFFSSLFISALLSFYLVAPGKNGASSIADIFNLGSGTPWLVFLVSFVVIFAFHMVYMILWRSTYSFSFLPDYIVTKQGVIAKTENHLPYRSVQDVTISQGIVERMLGLATVRIENAAAAQAVGKSVISSAVLIPGQPLLQANEISDAVKHVALTKSSSQTGL